MFRSPLYTNCNSQKPRNRSLLRVSARGGTMSKLVTVFGWAIFVALGLHAFPMHAWAQVNTTATLSGTVTDPVGALVPGAHVIAESVATKLPYEGVTDATGTYRLLNLP